MGYTLLIDKVIETWVKKLTVLSQRLSDNSPIRYVSTVFIMLAKSLEKRKWLICGIIVDLSSNKHGWEFPNGVNMLLDRFCGREKH